VAIKLKAMPEGNGTMLDNTLIIYLSDAAEKHHGNCLECPFILLGGLAGRYLQYPGYGTEGHRTIANLYNTLMHAVGKPQDQFGRLDVNLAKGLQRGPLPELLT
jgi:hypothetical protein|tara:strand:- start:2383 stop:2694 length:312 start_codon:yes stop_codon:yes gene_type:complete